MATVHIVQNDLKPNLDFAVSQDGEPVDLTDATVEFRMKNDATDAVKIADGAVTLMDAPNGKCRYLWQSGDTDTTGTFTGQVIITFPDNRPQSSYDPIKIVIAEKITAPE